MNLTITKTTVALFLAVVATAKLASAKDPGLVRGGDIDVSANEASSGPGGKRRRVDRAFDEKWEAAEAAKENARAARDAFMEKVAIERAIWAALMSARRERDDEIRRASCDEIIERRDDVIAGIEAALVAARACPAPSPAPSGKGVEVEVDVVEVDDDVAGCDWLVARAGDCAIGLKIGEARSARCARAGKLIMRIAERERVDIEKVDIRVVCRTLGIARRDADALADCEKKSDCWVMKNIWNEVWKV
jgi:hypothetical protein